MLNIKFIDRKEEIKEMKNASKNNFFLVLKGRRRIGKTTLLKKSLPNAVYIFIWPNKSLDWIIEQICLEHDLPKFRRFIDILIYLHDKKKMIILDEFQNFLHVDRSVYGEMQKFIDEKKINKKFLKIAVAGSSNSLISKVFYDIASPLYGRRTKEINLGHLPIKELFKELAFSMEDFIKLWSVFEGAPYYYELLEHCSAEENIKKIILEKNARLQEEGKVVISMEFGKDSKTYGTILSAIAESKTKLNEIAGLFENKSGEVTKYLDILRKEFKLVRRLTPLLENPNKSKEGRYEIIDNFLSFWFYFVDKNRNYIEQERFKEIEEKFGKDFSSFVGKKFEKFIMTLIKNQIIKFNFKFIKIGRQWGKFKGEKGKNTYEIDILALNEQSKQILFCECKWKDKVNAEKILAELKEKANYVDWHNEDRKESFAVFAKSFSKRLNKFEGKKIYCFDLKDIKKDIQNSKTKDLNT